MIFPFNSDSMAEMMEGTKIFFSVLKKATERKFMIEETAKTGKAGKSFDCLKFTTRPSDVC